MKDGAGKTARERATAKGHKDVVAEIDRWLAQEAAWEQEAARNDSFLAAARGNDVPTLETLASKGVNLLLQDSEGYSALFLLEKGEVARSWRR